MPEALTLLVVLGAGVALGMMFFGGLWWTIRKGVVSPRPAVWFLGSLVVRMALVMAGVYLVAGNRWERLLACLVGFILARLVVTWLTGKWAKEQVRSTPEAGHAP